MLPRYIEAIRPQTKSLCSTNNNGPGLRPHTIRPPSRIAAVPEPGMPSASIGSSAAVPEACAAVSGANTPSMRPLPKLSGSLENRLARFVAHERGGDRAARSDAQPAADERRAQQSDPVVRQVLPDIEDDAQADLGGMTAQRQALLHRQQDFADSEQAEHGDQKLMPRNRSLEPEGHAQLAGHRIHADAGEQQAERHRDDGLVFFLAAEADERAEGQEIDRENSGGPNFSAKDEISGAWKVIRRTATSDR